MFFIFFFFFNDTATTEIYTLSLHDALPICRAARDGHGPPRHTHPFGEEPHQLRVRRAVHRGRREPDLDGVTVAAGHLGPAGDRKSTRLNSSHLVISYAVFCLKKKKTTQCQESARQSPDEPARAFYQKLANYCGAVATDVRHVLDRRGAADSVVMLRVTHRRVP